MGLGSSVGVRVSLRFIFLRALTLSADGRDAGGVRSGGETSRPRRLQPLLLLPGGSHGPVVLEPLCPPAARCEAGCLQPFTALVIVLLG